MSQYTALPAEQSLHTSVFLDVEHHDVHVDIDTMSQETSGPPPSYTTTDALVHFDSDVKYKPTEPGPDTSLGDSPAQLPFDDLIGGSSSTRLTRRSLPAPPPQQQENPPMDGSRLENRDRFTHVNDFHNRPQPPQHSPASFPHPRLRPELPHATRSAPDPKVKLGNIAELEEIDPYGNKFHDESPFEAARRAQRVSNGNATGSSSPRGRAYANGRLPSIKPGEIMPVNTMRPTNSQPAFFPPLEAPPFPPTVHTPIRPAHFPQNLHPPPPPPEPARSPSHRQPLPLQPPQIPRSNSHRGSPPAPRPAPPLPLQPSRAPSQRQPPIPTELLRTPSHPNLAPPPPPQPIRSQSYPHALPPNAPPQHEYLSAPPPSRRHTYNVRDGVPPGLAPHGRYPSPQPPPPSVPPQQGQPQQHRPPEPPSRMPSQHQQHHPPPQRSILRDSQRHSIAGPPPSQFAPRSLSPVRLPSQNIPTPQALGVVHSPPTPSGSPRPDSSRPPGRPTPKPVMPQLLAPLVAQEYSLGRGGTGQLQRTTSSAPVEKGGLLSKTKSILRKRHSSAGIRTHTDGAISFAPQASKRYENHVPPMPSLTEETGMGGGKLGKRLSKRR